jgi:hypothetical protein
LMMPAAGPKPDCRPEGYPAGINNAIILTTLFFVDL